MTHTETRDAYLYLRKSTKDLLYNKGVPSNTGVEDEWIVNSLRCELSLPPLVVYDEGESTAQAFTMFLSSLMRIIQDFGANIPQEGERGTLHQAQQVFSVLKTLYQN